MHPRSRDSIQRYSTSTKPAVGGLVAEVRMSLEEFLALTKEGRPARQGSKRRSSPPKRKGKALKGMKTAMKKAHSRAKLKNGKFRKGWNQSKMMKYAHKVRVK